MEQSNTDIALIEAADGQKIEVTRLGAIGSPHGRTCIIGPAMAVPRRFYGEFARFLAEAGFDVLSLDFRFGGSAAHPLRFDDGFRGFGLDLSAAIEEAQRWRPENALVFVGHSLGGKAIGLTPHNGLIERAVSVASGSGYYGWSPFPHDRLRYVFWTAFVPPLTRIAGYFPGRSLGVLGDLPKPIALEWARLCKIPGYLRESLSSPPVPFFEDFRAPFLFMSFDDDAIMPRRATDDLAANYTNAKIERVHLMPADIGLSRVGHMNAFRKGREVLWPAMARWLKGGPFDAGFPKL
jgi:predicted alpha/beta hydrolase